MAGPEDPTRRQLLKAFGAGGALTFLGTSGCAQIEMLFLDKGEKDIVSIAKDMVTGTLSFQSANINYPQEHPVFNGVKITSGSVNFASKGNEQHPLILSVENAYSDDNVSSSNIRIAGGWHQKVAEDAGANPWGDKPQPIPKPGIRMVAYSLLNLYDSNVNDRPVEIDYGWGKVDALNFSGTTRGGRRFFGYLDTLGQGQIFAVPSSFETPLTNPWESTPLASNMARPFFREAYLAEKEVVYGDPLDENAGLPFRSIVEGDSQMVETRFFLVDKIRRDRREGKLFSLINQHQKTGGRLTGSIFSSELSFFDGANQIVESGKLKPGVSNENFFDFIRPMVTSIFDLERKSLPATAAKVWTEEVGSIFEGRQPELKVLDQLGRPVMNVSPKRIQIIMEQ